MIHRHLSQATSFSPGPSASAWVFLPPPPSPVCRPSPPQTPGGAAETCQVCQGKTCSGVLPSQGDCQGHCNDL